MKLSHRLAAACLLAVPLSCLAADPPAAKAEPQVKESALFGGWQAVSVTPKGPGGKEVLEPKKTDPILEFLADHVLRLHAPCGPRRDGLKAKGEDLFIAGSWSIDKDGKLRLQASIGEQKLDEAIPIRLSGDRLQFVNGAANRPDEFVRYKAELPVKCE